jgi:hypothetical protein
MEVIKFVMFVIYECSLEATTKIYSLLLSLSESNLIKSVLTVILT